MCFKMMLWAKRNFPYSFFILLTQWHEFNAQNWQIFQFLSLLSLWTWYYFQRVLIWLHLLKWIMRRVTLEGFLKKTQIYIQDHRHTTAKIELFVALVSSFQPLTSFTKNNNIGPEGDLHKPLEYYNVFWNLCRRSN